MPHPPPKSGHPICDSLPWSAPFLPSYERPLHQRGAPGQVNLTQCNYYLPQAGKGIHRFLWQIQYLVSQGFYVLLDFNSQRWWEPNVQYLQLLALNWGNLWRAMKDLPEYEQHMSGRVFADLVNEPSRWNCQWDSACYRKEQARRNGTDVTTYKPLCAPALQSYGMTAAAIWELDPTIPVFVNGFGQNRNFGKDICGGDYNAMSWGDGFITNLTLRQRSNLSDPSDLLATTATKMAGPGLVLAPHLYPPSITRNPPESPAVNQLRWNMSWGLKMLGQDATSKGVPLPKLPVVVGELGAYDYGDPSKQNRDYTSFTSYDKLWFARTATYLKAMAASAGTKMSWFYWCWNANSHDTKGIVGGKEDWKSVQWRKVRMLSRQFELVPWYCKHYPAFCEQVEW